MPAPLLSLSTLAQLDTVTGAFDGLVRLAGAGATALADAITPMFGGSAMAITVIIATVCVRAALLPLSLAGHRAAKARRHLAPLEARLRRQHATSPGRLARELADLRVRHGMSPTGMSWRALVPMLAQLPLLAVLYRLFSAPTIGGSANLLYTHSLFGVPLGDRFVEVVTAGVLSPPVAVYLAVLGAIAAVAWWSGRQARRSLTDAMPDAPPVAARLGGLLPYGTVVAAAVMPLAVGLYLLTSTTWTAVERRLAA